MSTPLLVELLVQLLRVRCCFGPTPPRGIQARLKTAHEKRPGKFKTFVMLKGNFLRYVALVGRCTSGRGFPGWLSHFRGVTPLGRCRGMNGLFMGARKRHGVTLRHSDTQPKRPRPDARPPTIATNGLGLKGPTSVGERDHNPWQVEQVPLFGVNLFFAQSCFSSFWIR